MFKVYVKNMMEEEEEKENIWGSAVLEADVW